MKELKLNAVGAVLNRAARKQKMELLIDPSEEQFLSRATAAQDRVGIIVRSPNMAPIELSGIPIGCRLRLRDVKVKDTEMIGLLEFLINDDEAGACRIELVYNPDDDLPFEPDEAPSDERLATIDASCEAIQFTPAGIQQALVQIKLRSDDGRWRHAWSWRLGRHDDHEPVAMSACHNDKARCFSDCCDAVIASIGKMVIAGSADHRRAVENRRDDVLGQFREWSQKQIKAMKAVDEPRTTGNGSPAAAAPSDEIGT